MKEAIQIIKEELEKRGIKVLKIILFGSRAREDYQEDSDWDLSVIIERDLSFPEKVKLLGEIYKKIARTKEVSIEIIITSQERFEELKKYIGTLAYNIEKEGVVVWS
jgi:predicted nucleotidyltransferase